MWSMLYYLRNEPEVLRWSQRVRGEDPEVVDKALEYDKKWRMLSKKLDELRHERNKITRTIGLTKNPEERARLIEQAKLISQEIKNLENEVKKALEQRNSLLLSIPNIVHESVPKGASDEDNIPVFFYGKPKVWKGFLELFKKQTKGFKVDFELVDEKPLSHYELGYKLGLVDTERAARVAGSRFFYLYEDLVWLDIALTLYAMDFLTKRGYTLVLPPFMLTGDAYRGVTSLEDFKDSIYKIENANLYLIATAEHPLASMFMNEVLEEKELPLRIAGISPCFRKEAGAHGKDTKGIFRVHQFNKVEQFIFSLPEDSWQMHEELINNAIELWRNLGIPFRIVNVCTGDLGIVAAKKYDLEAWMPGQGRYREMVSCSNCTDYQSYRLNIRYAEKRGYPTKGFVHTLNSTAIATTRTITAIMENYQLEDGVIAIPDVLKPYLEMFKKAPHDYIYPLKRPPLSG